LILDVGDDPETLALSHFGHGPLTVLSEVKVTRADFLQDRKRYIEPAANVCILTYTPKVLKSEKELPPYWFGLRLSEDGTKLTKVVRNGWVFSQHPGRTLDFIAQVAIRRDHRSRYRATRDWIKAYRAKDSERQRQYSAARLLMGISDWLEGEGHRPDRSLVDVLPELGVKKIPSYLLHAVESLEKRKDARSG
jgi:hypothetical protein